MSKIDQKTVTALLNAGLVNEEQVAMCTGLHYKIGYVNLRSIKISPETIDLMTSDVANFLRCIPFHTGLGKFCVAVEDPTRDARMDSIHHFFDKDGAECGIAVASKSGIDYALDLYYPPGKPPHTPVPRKVVKSRTPKEYPWNIGEEQDQLPLINHTTGTGTNAAGFVRIAS